MNEYWIKYWKKHGENAQGMDKHSQVLRTLNKKPISEEQWQFTLGEIDKHFEIRPGDKVLDLCCGNGLISKHLADKGAYVRAVDVSEGLLEGLTAYDRIEPEIADIRNLDYGPDSYDHVLIYAGIQYFTLAESFLLFEKLFHWLKPNGTVFIGDIPDLDKQFDFYNNAERRAVYFQNLLSGTDVVGTWFIDEWLLNAAKHFEFSNAEILPQTEGLLNANYRFDLKLTK